MIENRATVEKKYISYIQHKASIPMSNILSMEWKLLQVIAALNGLIFNVYHYLMKIKTVILLSDARAVIKLLKYRFSAFKAKSLLMSGLISQ